MKQALEEVIGWGILVVLVLVIEDTALDCGTVWGNTRVLCIANRKVGPFHGVPDVWAGIDTIGRITVKLL